MFAINVWNQTGIGSRRAALSAAVVLGSLAGSALAAPTSTYTGRVCYMGDYIKVWVEWNYDSIDGNYDPASHTGAVSYTVTDGQSPDDFSFEYVDNTGSVRLLTGPVDMAMGTFDVQGGLGTSVCSVSFPDIWITYGGYGIHLIFNPATPLAADMQLTGFTDDGQGIYLAEGLAIPMDFEVVQPDGTTVIASDVCHTLEFRSPLDLAPACAADCDGNGILNIDDIDCFVASFLNGCV